MLVYTSEELVEPLEVTGPIKVVLYATSNAPDTDWTAKLVDVHPNGRAFNLCDGIIRVGTANRLLSRSYSSRARSTATRSTCGQPATSFRGHRIRVEVSSSNFPRFDRNPNTGHPFGVDAELRKANQIVYHDQEHPSHILLPVIP